MEPYNWEPNGLVPHPVKYESEAAVAGFPYCTETSLNFSTAATNYSEDDADYNNTNNNNARRNKTSRQDPLSHRIIEKRRRDRMNSCLADLSRLIPPQYARKGRGRIEKTEIIEMAIKHLKHLQNNCVHKEIEYKLGYSDCMKEAAKFLYESHMQDCCYRLLAHLQEHCDEIMKGDCFKNRCNIENPSNGNNAINFHHSAPISQLRDMLTSDIEHSNDHNDIKDFSIRNPHQAPVITSTAIHNDSNSNHEFENGISPSPPHHLNQNSLNSSTTTQIGLPKPIRTRNLSESSHDIEHNNNYKYKNHIKERFNHDTQLHDESTSDHSIITTNDSCCPNDSSIKAINCTNINKNSNSNNHSNNINNNNNVINNNNNNNNNCTSDCNSLTKKRKLNTTDNKNDIIVENLTKCNLQKQQLQQQLIQNKLQKQDEHKPNDIKLELPPISENNNKILLNSTTNNCKYFSVPIFALHGQGTYYVPLNIDYKSLLPYLNGIDLLDKNQCPMLHPVNINVNFSIPSATNRMLHINNKLSKLETNGW